MSEQRFTTTLDRSDNRASVTLPFDPNAVWGARERHHVTGTVHGRNFRGCLEAVGGRYLLSLGPAWLRAFDAEEGEGIGEGESVEVVLMPEGPQVDTLDPDMADALRAEPDARAFFESLPTFYRNNFVRRIGEAKRPETRARRIAEMMELLRAGKKER